MKNITKKLVSFSLGLVLSLGVGVSLATANKKPLEIKATALGDGFTKITTANIATELKTGDTIALYNDTKDLGVAGFNSNNKDALVSANQYEWDLFTVEVSSEVDEEDSSKTNYFFTAKDSSDKYISVTKNNFKSSSGTVGENIDTSIICTVNNDGVFGNGTYWLQTYSTYYRCYNADKFDDSTYSSFYVYKVTNKYVTSISVKTQPTKFSYLETELFDPSGLVLNVTYSDGSNSDVTYATTNKGFSFNPNLETPLALDVTSVTVTYGELGFASSKIDITVSEDAITSLKIDSSSYNGKKFALNGSWFSESLTIKLVRASGKEDSIEQDDENLSLVFNPAKPNSTELTSVSLTATYKELTPVTVTLSGFTVEEATEATYDFAKNFATYAKDWSSTYENHSLVKDDVDSTLSISMKVDLLANKSTSTIKDAPVFKTTGDVIVFNLKKEGYKVTDIEITFKLWSDSKKPEFALYDGASGEDKTPVATFNPTKDALVLTATVSNSHFTLSKITNEDQIGLASIKITIAKDTSAEWVSSFLSKTNTACSDASANNAEALKGIWSDLASSYEALDATAKADIKKADADNAGNNLEKAVARYDHIITRYSKSYSEINNFINRSELTTSPLGNILSSDNNTLTIAIIVIVSLVSVSSIIGTTLIVHKRKEN